jgi:hypothetical protein
MTEEDITTDKGIVTTVREVKEAYIDVYGSDDVNHYQALGKDFVKSDSYPDKTAIFEREGHTAIDLSEAQPEIESKVKQNVTGSSTSTVTEQTSGEEVDVVGSRENERISDFENTEATSEDGNELIEVYSNGAIEFMPQFTKEEADYHGPAQGGSPELDCKDCAHYIEGGGCHIVQGGVDPDGHCENYYADVGFFGRGADIPQQKTAINLTLWGERAKKRLQHGSAAAIVQKIKEEITDKVGERYVQFVD